MFSNFQTEDKYTKLYNILYCRSACGNPSHGNNCKVPYRYALYPAKAVVTASNLYTGKKSV